MTELLAAGITGEPSSTLTLMSEAFGEYWMRQTLTFSAAGALLMTFSQGRGYGLWHLLHHRLTAAWAHTLVH